MNTENTPDLTPIDLAREPDFALGALQVSPSTREVMRVGWKDSLEPRVMQVLVALNGAHGAVVSRDDLIARCWEGRVVGEDAINRAIGRLRRLSEADNGASFTIETIARVGYRLRLTAGAAQPLPSETPAPDPIPPAPLPRPTRRWLLAGAGLAAVGVGLVTCRPGSSDEVQDSPRQGPRLGLLIEQGKQAQRMAGPEAQAQSMGMFEHLTQIAPNSADAWGGLALSYAYLVHNVPSEASALRLRAMDAIRHARQIQPHHELAYVAEANLLPMRGAWIQKEALLREGLRSRPKSDEVLLQLADFLNGVGRNEEAADLVQRAITFSTQPDPALTWLGIQICWAAGRLSEADAITARGVAMFPRQRSVWFSRIFFLMFTGRADEALVSLNIRDGRPLGSPEADFDAIIAVATALKTNNRGDIDKAVATNLALAHEGGGYAENAMMFSSGLGRLNEAFLVANSLYFNRGFKIGEFRFSANQGARTVSQDRRTRHLFLPPTKAMRHDPRFGALVEEIGLARYWQDAGVKPDYQTGKDG